MENASKALIIAGAILVSILLISIGVIIINSTGDMQDQVGTTTDTMAIETFNAQFTQYEGSTVPASTVRSLISKVNASNSQNTQQVKLLDGSKKQITSSSSITSGKTYSVSITKYDKGYVNEITVK